MYLGTVKLGFNGLTACATARSNAYCHDNPAHRRRHNITLYGYQRRVAGAEAVTMTSRRKFPLSLSELSIAFALGLALWEWYFFFVVSPPPLENVAARLGVFTPTRLGFNLAWLGVVYLTYQLISIPFALPAARGRFIGVVDGMASLVPLAVVLIVVFGKPYLLSTPERWETAFLLMVVNVVDLFGGYAFNIALSRRMVDVTPPLSP